LAAFESAVLHGAELVEVDLRRTADAVLVCVHDPHLPGLGPVSALEYHRLSGREREGVLRWEGFLEVLDEGERTTGRPAGSTSVHLDLKDVGYEAASMADLEKRGRPCVVTSGEDESIAAVRRVAPDVQALLTLGGSGRGMTPRQVASMRASEFWPLGRLRRCDATGIAAHGFIATAPLRRWCRRHGMTVLVWTIDSASALERWLAEPDVDIVTTNRPLAAAELRDRLARS
jgi:glycerophosphoryl diester phosphodiesterase